ncbi:GNAT family acetyltransferase [Sporosarcina newyorkensis 2681]|uniref:GNAT family acetyltransferase n=1 Tax=Sporosarcina newyorkensis 2681 TaxID=1027292 RepID=F9DWC5_9BACL|nr:GNAT family N-acetyltransferase [Sporosarcina newyorkensis]EGQ21746.1 GNAT family acetyltransferase [Sporosarcina newyorkensis 2681]
MQIKRITNEENLKKAFEIRKMVFVEEQNVPVEDEFDEFDILNGKCKHILVVDQEQVVGTGRIREVEGVGKLERICILPSHRQLGMGKVIVSALEEIAREQGIGRVKLHGQTHAERFYQKLGYETVSDVFMEDGIPHIIMRKELTVKSE